MYGLEFALVLILLAVCYLLSYPFGTNGTKNTPVIKIKTSGNQPVVLVIGATSSQGQKVLNLLKDKPVNLIAISRREARWLKIRDNFPRVAWYRGDLRLSNEMDYLFEQIKQHYGRIDYVINLAYISGDVNSIGSISSLRVKEDVFFKLSNAYDQELLPHNYQGGRAGEETPLFTNIIGCVVLKNLCRKYNVGEVGLILGTDKVVNELISTFANQNLGLTKFTPIEPTQLTNKINELVQL